MARKTRELLEGGIYHVFARGNARHLVFLDNVDRAVYLQRLEKLARELDWSCLAFCLMENHVHLLLETHGANLSAGMRRLHGAYAQGFNARHDRCGHVFQGRFGAVRVATDRQLRAVAVYIARNPVEAGLCALPEAWTWSSYRPVIGCAESLVDADRLLSHFGDEVGAARLTYQRAVNLKGD